MNTSPIRKSRNPAAKREALLTAARTLIARDGPDGLSLAETAKLAGVGRGTAYQRFANREELVEATLKSVSDQLFEAAFGHSEIAAERGLGDIDILRMTTALADFAAANPELCRIWFLKLLASKHPERDPFIHFYLERFKVFAQSDLATDGVDSEVVTLIMLSANFLWPVWAGAQGKNDLERQALARRFVNEVLRLSLFGTMRAGEHPALAEAVLSSINATKG